MKSYEQRLQAHNAMIVELEQKLERLQTERSIATDAKDAKLLDVYVEDTKRTLRIAKSAPVLGPIPGIDYRATVPAIRNPTPK